MVRRKKMIEELTAYEIIKLHRKSIRKGVGRRYRIPVDTTKTIPEKVICFVYTDIFTGEVTRKWVYGKDYTPHFDYENILLVTYNATAEIGSYLKQLHGRPKNIWDAYVETSRLYKPMRMGKGALTLLTTAENYGIEDKLTVVEKERNPI